MRKLKSVEAEGLVQLVQVLTKFAFHKHFAILDVNSQKQLIVFIETNSFIAIAHGPTTYLHSTENVRSQEGQ